MEMAKNNRRYTVQDYMTWDDDERWELINGVAYNMSAAPAFRHQKIVGNFFVQLSNALNGKTCTPVVSPTDVILSEDTTVQPDVFVVCDPKKITDTVIHGAPDLIIEVLSPWTSTKDRREKKSLYESFGVREYIVADPNGLNVERFVMESNGKYNAGEIIDNQEILTLYSLHELQIPLWEVFDVEKKTEE